MSYSVRLRKVRKELGLTQNELAKIIGLKNKQTISDIETGKQQRLSAKHELTFCRKYNIDILWLQMGLESTSPQKIHVDKVRTPYQSYGENITLVYYPEDQITINHGNLVHLQNKKMMTFQKSFIELYLGLKAYEDLFVIDSSSESMEPTLPVNALLFVNPMYNEKNIRDGSIYLIACNDVILVKRLHHNPMDDTHVLVSDNPKNDDIIISNFQESGCRCIGRVVGYLSKL